MNTIRQLSILLLLTATISGCGGGTELGAPVTGGDKITLTNVIIETAAVDTVNNNIPMVSPFDSLSGNFTLKWDSNYSNIYATVKIGIGAIMNSTANKTIFLNGQCSTSFQATGCERPTSGNTSTLQCRYSTTNIMTCGRNVANNSTTPQYVPAEADITQLAGNILTLFIEVCGDPGNGQGGAQCTNISRQVSVK